MDRSRAGLPALTALGQAPPAGSIIDLHVHSTASDGGLAPEVVVERALAAGLGAISLTDHDTVAGVPAAVAAGERLGVRVIAGCEFSTAAPWGEMHVLGYFLPTESAALETFLERCRADRLRRAREMVERLQALGVTLDFDDVLRQARGGAVGRPHVARAIVRSGQRGDHVGSVRSLHRAAPARVRGEGAAHLQGSGRSGARGARAGVGGPSQGPGDALVHRAAEAGGTRRDRDPPSQSRSRHPLPPDRHLPPPRPAPDRRQRLARRSRARARPTAPSARRRCRWNGSSGSTGSAPTSPPPRPPENIEDP